jgi:hypothetical protein
MIIIIRGWASGCVVGTLYTLLTLHTNNGERNTNKGGEPGSAITGWGFSSKMKSFFLPGLYIEKISTNFSLNSVP